MSVKCDENVSESERNAVRDFFVLENACSLR